MADKDCPEKPHLEKGDGEIISIATLVLAEKRTSLAVLRTGVAVGLIPLSITTALVALSKSFEWTENLHFLVPMYAVLTVLTLVSLYLIGRALQRIHHHDEILARLRKSSPTLGPFID
jgi:hypothetical protein